MDDPVLRLLAVRQRALVQCGLEHRGHAAREPVRHLATCRLLATSPATLDRGAPCKAMAAAALAPRRLPYPQHVPR